MHLLSVHVTYGWRATERNPWRCSVRSTPFRGLPRENRFRNVRRQLLLYARGPAAGLLTIFPFPHALPRARSACVRRHGIMTADTVRLSWRARAVAGRATGRLVLGLASYRPGGGGRATSKRRDEPRKHPLAGVTERQQ